MAAGQIVPAFEILDATHKKVLDGGHGVAYYWVGKNKAATLFSATPAGPFGMDHFDFLGWLHEGGGKALYDEFYRDVLKLNVIGMPIGGSSPQAFGWFKRPIKDLADFKGMKCRQTGIVAEIFQRMGMQTVNMPGGEIVPVGAARRDRLRRVGRRHRGPAPRPAAGVEVPLHAGHARVELDARGDHQHRRVEGLHAAAAGGVARGARWRPSCAGACEWQKQNADAIEEMRTKHGTQILRTPPDDPDRVPEDLGQDGGRGVGEEPVLQEGARLAARVRGQGGAGEALHVPAVLVRRELLLPGEAQARGEGKAKK